MFTNFVHISSYDKSSMQTSLNYFKRELAAWKGLRCPPSSCSDPGGKTVATSYNGVGGIVCDWCLTEVAPRVFAIWETHSKPGTIISYKAGFLYLIALVPSNHIEIKIARHREGGGGGGGGGGHIGMALVFILHILITKQVCYVPDLLKTLIFISLFVWINE